MFGLFPNKMFRIIVCCYVVFKFASAIVPTPVGTLEQKPVLESSSFMNYLQLSVMMNKCTLRHKGTTYALDVKSTKKATIASGEATDISKRLYSVGHGLCGAKVENVTDTDTGLIRLNAEDSDERVYDGQFSLTVIKLQETSDKKVTVELGQKYEIHNCGKRDDTIQEYCDLYNPAGELAATDQYMNYTIDRVTLRDIGNWTCVVTKSNAMKPTKYYIELVKRDREEVVTWARDEDDEVSLGCEIRNLPGFSSCRYLAPNNDSFYVTETFATSRYSSLNQSASVCSLQIKKPLKRYENGYWKCEMKNPTVNTVFGAYIKVGDPPTPEYPKRLLKAIEIDKEFNVTCQVPYHSRYCYIKDPQKVVVHSNYGMGPSLGNCNVNIKKAGTRHVGEWSCYFATQTGHEDERIIVDVKIPETLSNYTSVEVYAGEQLSLLCRSHLPLSYCRFESPSGKSYYLENVPSNTAIRYYGKGLDHGECGISIDKATAEHGGYWECATNIKSQPLKAEITQNISVKVENNITSTAGFTLELLFIVGGLIMAGTVAIGSWNLYKRRQGQFNNEPVLRLSSVSHTSQSSDGSNEVRFSQNNNNELYVQHVVL